MPKANLGWLYYKELYRHGADDEHIKRTLQKLTSATSVELDKQGPGAHKFTLKTTYPGLIIGSGYTHGVASEEDAKTGFYFEHTTGLPLIPGSSVKGVLRSLFGLPQQGQTEQYKNEKSELIRSLLNNDTLDVDTLAKEIFEGINHKTGKALPMYQRDTFYDATISGIGSSLILEDYITPHKNPLQDPTPIKIIKIAGGVSFTFGFHLKDGYIKAKEKELLFLELLQLHGVGAKTNVGYGQFEALSVDKFKQKKDDDNEDPVDKLFKEYDSNAANIINLYVKEEFRQRVEPYKESFKTKLLELLYEDLKKVKNKFKPKVEGRIEKVKNF